MRTIDGTFHTGYDLFTYLFSLYDRACEFEYIEKRQALWSQGLGLAWNLVEKFCELLEIIELEKSYQMPSEAYPENFDQIAESLKKVKLLSNSLTCWSSLNSYLIAIETCESYTLDSLSILASFFKCDGLFYYDAITSLQQRLNLLRTIRHLLDEQNEVLARLPQRVMI